MRCIQYPVRFVLRGLNNGCALLFFLFALPLLEVRGQPADVSRAEAIRQDIEASQLVLVDLTNELERAQWQQRLDLLNQDLENVQRRGQLEEKERSLSEQHQKSNIYALRDALRAIDINLDETGGAIKNLNRAILRLREERSDLQKRRQRMAADAEAYAENVADLDQQIRNKSEEILARALERDLGEMRLRLGEEAKRIEEHIRALPINPRPTIRLLLERRRYLAAEKKNGADTGILQQELKDHRAEISAALGLSQAKFANLDTEIDILQKKKQVIRSRQEISQLLYLARSERKMCQDRIVLQQQQEKNLGDTLDLGAQLQDLYDKEAVYLGVEYTALVRNYWRRLLIPIGGILMILASYLLVARLLLPRFYSHEELFISRRLGNYLVVLLILFTLCLFFLEDLKAIATVMGIAGAAVVIALQDLCLSFAGYFVIMSSRKLAVGNRVEIDGHRGDVVDIQLLRTTLLELRDWLEVDEPTGRFVIIPNSFIFKSKVFNFSHVHPYIWGKIDITVTYETPVQVAQDLLQRVLEEVNKPELDEAARASDLMQKKYGIVDTEYKPKLFTLITDHGVLFRLLYVCHYRKFSGTRNRINARILQEFEKDARLQFAYPTQRHIPTPEAGGFPVRVQPAK